MDNVSQLDLSRIPQELEFLIELLKWEPEEAFPEGLTDRYSELDWELFMQLTLHHRVYPVLTPKLKRLGDRVPSHVTNELTHLFRRNTFQMLHLTAEMEQLSQLFTEQHIPLLFLKGPTLAHELYSDISLRTSSDLDFIVPIDELEKAEKILLDRGYEKDDYIQTVLNDWKWRHHHVTYFHPKKKLKAEIHWRLNPGPSKEPDFTALWNRKITSGLTKTPVYTLGREDMFLFLVSHGSRHGWSRLRWLMDIHQLLNQKVNWKRSFSHLEKYDYLRAGGQAVYLSSSVFGSPVPMKGIRKYASLAQQAVFYMENQVNLHTDPLPEEFARYHKNHLFSLMSFKQKLFFIMSFMHPYPEDAQTLPLPAKLHVLYFPLRPFLWVWRKTRSHALPQGD
ncbi:nucleotidyltransferase domain-containing protein [Jeotgalibacillus proteolyticus]|uniref:Renal dipeptidase n=1 Tax=Jeotgalibacillus proteolyticus TaxID=2082395 RepID=A0A2S5G8I0_9BACL|nr:nucleotidyltransferase family protein [Jeotgalibacillus proteolyticus]PPA69224.1 Renal dipeptidase [Jeotgalibacillus proteolyticus]